jgi:sulfur-oxidizing protein SoxZ
MTPRIRLSKSDVARGEIIEIKTLLGHVMESGQRRDVNGERVPRKIINRFICEFNGQPVFSCDLEPAIAANPYIQFRFRAVESGELKLTWIDDDGSRIVAVEAVVVR